MAAYNKGLYQVSGNTIEYKSEADSLASVIKTPNYAPIDMANPNKDFCHTSSHSIETVNGNNYTVLYTDVKWESKAMAAYGKSNFESIKTAINAEKRKNIELSKASKEKLKKEIDKAKEKAQKKKGFLDDLKDLIDGLRGKHKEEAPKSEVDREEINAPMFYEMMGIDVNETIAIVIDAASIGLIDILSRGKFAGKRPTVYYIYGPEVVHDPATKKHPSSPEFKDPKVWLEGVEFIPCVSLNPSSFVYSYDYNPTDTTGLYLNKFFTNFQFELSELKETPKGKTIDYSTDLTIKAFDKGGKIKFIDESIDSKSKSDITFLTKIIEALKGAFKSGDEKEFKYAISFLKKMSGDWLQVLLTLAITSRTRGFTPYKNREPGMRQQNITAKIDRTFFVTHDQIALSFALLMGVECLFTHHGPVEGNPSLHSAFLFSLTNEETLNASIIAKASAMNKDYASEITSLTAGLKTYNENYETALNSSKVDLASYLDGYLRGEIITPFEVDVFDKYVKTIFTTALKFVATKKILPDLTDTQISIAELTTQNAELQSKIAAFKKDDVLAVASAKELLELDARISSKMQNVKKIIDSAQDFFSSDDDKGTAMNIKNKIRDFTKTLIYTSADKWTWDSSEVNNRSLSKLTTVAETQKFNADRNIFVNHLDALDDETKSKITLLFAKCYRYISADKDQKYGYTPIKKKGGENKLQELTSTQIMKFKPMATTFCYEVFINFGGKFSGTNIATSGITQKEINDYCEGIISANEVLLLWDDVLEEEEKEESRAIVTGPDHLSEAVLVAQMNDDAKILDTGVDSFNTPVGESVKEKSQSKISMNLNSVFSACNLLKHRLLSTPKQGGSAAGGERAYSAYGGFSAFSRRGPIMKGGAPTCNFNPQLPLYILLFQLGKTLANENYKESHDFELVLQTYDFLLKMKTKLDEIEDINDKCEFALSIRDFFFINNVVSDKIKVTKVPVLPPKFLSFMGLLTTGFCGALNETYFGDVEDRRESINNPVFTAFISDVASCFNTQFDWVMDEIKYTDFVEEVSESAQDLAHQIVVDRGSDGKQDDYENEMKHLASIKNDTGVFEFGRNGSIAAHGGRKTRRNRKRRTRRPSKNVVGKRSRKRSSK